MSDLISRQDAIDAFDGIKVNLEDCTEYDIGYNDGIDYAVNALSVIPSTQKTGKWLTPKEYCQHLYETTGERYLPVPTGLESFVYCSQCGETSWFSNKYCPHCGSRNRGEGE